MTSAGLLTDTFGRIRDVVHEAVEGLSVDDLMHRIDAEANSIDWLVWHLTRVQDDHVAGVAGTPQVWTSAGWAQRCGLPFGESEHGYGHTSAQVAAVNLDAATLLGYHDAVCDATLTFLGTLTDVDLDRVVDKAWDPPVTMSVRLVSVIADSLQHAGQAAFIRGILARR